MTTPTSTTMVNLDEVKSSLMIDNFDVEKHASTIIQSGIDIGDKIRDLGHAHEEIDQQIQDHVFDHYEDLLSQATGIEALGSHVTMMKSHVSSLVSAADRIRSKITEPFYKIRSQTMTLTRMQLTCDLLRRIIRILQLSKKLKQQLNTQSEITKAAQSLSELAELWTPELSGIEIIEQNERFILQARNDVERTADSMLSHGLANQNQTNIGMALQVFYNLGVLETTIVDRVVIGQQLKEVETKVNELLNVKRITESLSDSVKSTSSSSSLSSSSSSMTSITGVPGRVPTLPNHGNMSAFRAIMWNNVETMLEVVFSKTCEMIHLQRILCKKRDTVTHVTFIEILPESSRNLVADFWQVVLKILKENLKKASKQSNFMKQALEGEYPKLLRLYKDLWSRLRQSVSAYSVLPSELPVPLLNPFQSQTDISSLREIMTDFERSYLSRSLSRLFDPINVMFSAGSGNIPSQTELDDMFRTIGSELKVANVDDNLNLTVSKNVAKTVQLFCTKCEQALITDGDASQVIGYPTEGQKRNVEIVNLLYAFKLGVLNEVESNNNEISEALDKIDQQMKYAIDPLLNSVHDAIEAIILTLHNEVNKVEDGGSSCSLYMKELQAFVSRVSVDYLNGFQCKEFIYDIVKPLVHQTIEMFILHASLVRPLSKDGQMSLASDCAQLELALEPLSPILKSGIHYERLRAFRSLLFVRPEEILQIPNLGSPVLPVSTVLHHLFSKAPSELKSPHESAGWSISRYSKWLDEHPSEQDRLQLIQGALESYVAGTRQRQDKSYAYPYPIMLQILQKALSL